MTVRSRTGAGALALGLVMWAATPAAADPAPVRVGDWIWLDMYGDGVQRPGDLPLAGVTCALSSDGTPVGAPVATDGAGFFHFDVTPDVDYTITCDVTTVTNLPPGIAAADLAVTEKGAGPDPRLDSNGAADQTIAVLTRAASADYDMGYRVAG